MAKIAETIKATGDEPSQRVGFSTTPARLSEKINLSVTKNNTISLFSPFYLIMVIYNGNQLNSYFYIKSGDKKKSLYTIKNSLHLFEIRSTFMQRTKDLRNHYHY